MEPELDHDVVVPSNALLLEQIVAADRFARNQRLVPLLDARIVPASAEKQVVGLQQILAAAQLRQRGALAEERALGDELEVLLARVDLALVVLRAVQVHQQHLDADGQLLHDAARNRLAEPALDPGGGAEQPDLLGADPAQDSPAQRPAQDEGGEANADERLADQPAHLPQQPRLADVEPLEEVVRDPVGEIVGVLHPRELDRARGLRAPDLGDLLVVADLGEHKPPPVLDPDGSAGHEQADLLLRLDDVGAASHAAEEFCVVAVVFI